MLGLAGKQDLVDCLVVELPALLPKDQYHPVARGQQVMNLGLARFVLVAVAELRWLRLLQYWGEGRQGVHGW